MQPFFSVIIPSYNRAHVLPATIESVRQQSFSDWEIVVVDDGSKDNTREVVEGIGDPRVRYVYQDNAERSAARNNGIVNANGKYICFLDSDDVYLPDHLQIIRHQIDALEEPVAMFFTDCSHSRPEGITDPPQHKLSGDPIRYFLTHPVIPARVCIHREILSEHRFDPDIVIVEDTILWIRIAADHPVFHIPQYTLLYTLNDDNSVNLKNNSYLRRLKGLKLFRKRYSGVFAMIERRLWKKIISDTLFGMARHYIFVNKRSKALFSLLQSIFACRRHPQTRHKFYLIVRILTLRNIPDYSPAKA
jgi:glycosyltransferase involved in cell wall biosynthesis